MEYRYVATNKINGNRISGLMNATSMTDLVVQLKSENLLPLKVTEIKPLAVKAKSSLSFFNHAANSKEIAIFTRQLAATLSAGLLLTESLETIADDLENEKFRHVIRKVKGDIQSGVDFSAALAKYPDLFPMTYVSIIKSGEATGNLHITAVNLAQYLENTERLKDKVKNAVRYPMFVAGFALLVVVVIVLFLIPQFQGMFASAGAKLPLLTRIVVAISQFCLHNVPFLMGGFIGLWALFFYALRFEKFRRMFDAFKLKVPILGKHIIHKALVSRFCRTLGFLFAGGIGLAKSLEITAQVVDHRIMADAINDIKSRVMAGSSLAEEIKKQKIFPRLTSKMAAVGERTGKVSEMFNRTADYYDNELDSSLQNLTTMLEPALIIFVGGIVLVVVLALYLPIFQMSMAIK